MRQSTFNNSIRTLFLVATPIGNLQDITYRAIEILNNVKLIACEDTRQTKKLLDKYDIKTETISCHEHNEKEASIKIIDVLKSGFDVAYVSDAGYPCISDPGSLLVKRVLEEEYNVSVIPGASAFISALIASGLQTNKFSFIGFLDNKTNLRKKELIKLKDKEETLIFYESPHRAEKSLNDMLDILGNRQACLARELTKKFEEYIRGPLSEIIEELKTELKGEMVVIIDGKKEEKKVYDDSFLINEINKLIKKNISSKDAIQEVSKTYDLKKNDIYKLYHK